MIRQLFLLLLCMVLTGCGNVRRNAERRVRAVGIEALRKDAAMLHRQVFARTGPGYTPVKLSMLPESFGKLEPKSCTGFLNGFAVSMQREGATEEGVFIIPESLDAKPEPTRHSSYDPIAPGVYWYRFSQ